MQSTTSLSTVIVAPPGRLRDGLSVLLRARREIALAGEADDLPSGLPIILERAPALVVLDGSQVADKTLDALRQLKAQAPQMRFICFCNHPVIDFLFR